MSRATMTLANFFDRLSSWLVVESKSIVVNRIKGHDLVETTVT